MTIPGRGGRPRKWNSDADRVRAHRARQRGEAEPPTVDLALASGDEAAVAWERVRALGTELDERRAVIETLRADVRSAKRALQDERRRFGWVRDENSQLLAEIELLNNEVQTLRDSVATLQRPSTAPTGDPESGTHPNRAARRRAVRRARRGPLSR